MFMTLVPLAALTAFAHCIEASHGHRHFHRRHDAGYGVVNLKRAGSHPASSRALSQTRPRFASHLESVESGSGYAVEIGFGDQTFSVHLDTGSSDLWIPTSNFQCLGPDGSSVPQQECSLGQTYNGGFTSGQIGNQEFNITYGDGEFLLGSMGYEDVSLGGLTVPRQQVALVTSGFWQGDSETSGLMGFAYPSLTSSTQETYYGDIQKPYAPFFFNAIQQGLVPPVFTLALGRNTLDETIAGQIGLGGGLPNIQTTTSFTSTPLRAAQLSPNPLTATNFSYYTIIPDGFILQGQPYQQSSSQQQAFTYGDFAPTSDSPSDIPVILDSGTSLVYLPTPLVQAIASSFSPPASYISSAGLYQADCDAAPPSFAVQIGGQAFTMQAQDVLLPRDGGFDFSTGGCVLGVQDAGASGGPNILGDAFLRNVVVEFDVGRGVVGVAGRG